MISLLLVGPSVRAAAFSALRAGLSPGCLDCFADRDLARHAPAQRLDGPFPEALLPAFATLPLPAETPWMFTGGLENYPDLLDALQRLRPNLWGNDAKRVRRVRDRAWLRTECQEVGLPMPSEGTWPPGPGRWLVKPMRSGGGRGIRPWSDTEPSKRPAGWYVQQWREGLPVGVIFAGLPERTVFLGATRQLVGLDWPGGAAFAYQGSVGPIVLPATVRESLTHLATRLDLRGLFGIDGLLDGEQFHVLEVNPRYSASVEVLEHAGDFAAQAWHRAAFDSHAPNLATPATPQRVIAKVIVYAKRAWTFPPSGPWDEALNLPVTALAPFADVPAPGEAIPAGAPLCTLLTEGTTVDSALETVHQRVREWLQ
jgi:predicted ATP-grasp superfamily ATP-dependent carboligase